MMKRIFRRFAAIGAVVVAASAAPAWAQATNQDVPPPLVNGLYIDLGACPGEGCDIGGFVRAYGDNELLANTDPDAPVIGTIGPREWVAVVETEERVVPRRGVLRRPSVDLEGLKPGDVVYMLGYEGEGYVTLYRRGIKYSWVAPSEDDGEGPEIVWDAEPPQELSARQGFFIKVRRADGQEGYLGAGDIECTSSLDRPAHCQWPNGTPPNEIDLHYGHESQPPEPWLGDDGLFAERKFCPGADCHLFGAIRAKEGVELVSASEKGAAAAGRVEPGEWIWILNWEYRVGRTPGVARGERGDLKPGDTVYALGELTPGCRPIFFGYFHHDVWCSGAAGVLPAAAVIDWGAPEPFDDKRAGLWVMVKRKSSGTPAYVRGSDIGKFACVTLQDRERDCPPIQMPPYLHQ